MVAVSDNFAQWLAQARIREQALTLEQRGVLQAAFLFRQRCGSDYYSMRLLSHFLLHCDSQLKVAQIARLVGISRPTASRQQGLSSKETIQQAHHRMDGRPYGKLLPRYAGPIAGFLLTHAQASRADLIDFIARTWNVRVSRIALYKFLKKFGLDEATRRAQTPSTLQPTPTAATPEPASMTPSPEPAPTEPSAEPVQPITSADSAPPAAMPVIALPETAAFAPLPSACAQAAQALGQPAPPFSAHARNTPVPSCCSARH